MLNPVEELLLKAQSGDLQAFEELVLLYQDRVYTHCMHLAGNGHDAQDLAQEVFVQAYRKLKSFRLESDLGTWLHRIAVNLWINMSRKNRKVVTISLDEPLPTQEGEVLRELAASEETPLEKVERGETVDFLRRILNSLPPDFKTVLILREVEGYSYEEIAGITGNSLGTVKSRINRARKALVKELERFRS